MKGGNRSGFRFEAEAEAQGKPKSAALLVARAERSRNVHRDCADRQERQRDERAHVENGTGNTGPIAGGRGDRACHAGGDRYQQRDAEHARIIAPRRGCPSGSRHKQRFRLRAKAASSYALPVQRDTGRRCDAYDPKRLAWQRSVQVALPVNTRCPRFDKVGVMDAERRADRTRGFSWI